MENDRSDDSDDAIEKKKDKYWKRMYKDNNESRIEKRLLDENYLKLQLENEVSLFRSLLINERMLEDNCITTRRFWLNHKLTLPHLFKLTKKLLNIQASTAFIERFFSICGIICSEKNTNMKDETIIMRSILKANIDTLNELCIENTES